MKDIFSVAPGTVIRSPGTLVFCALKIACQKKSKTPVKALQVTRHKLMEFLKQQYKRTVVQD